MAGHRSSSSSDMRRPDKSTREIAAKYKEQNCHFGSGFPGRFRRSGNGRRDLPTATGSGLLRSNVRVLIPILIARRKDDTRACNYITATDRRFAFGNKDAFIKSAPAAARRLLPFFRLSRLSAKAGALSPSPSRIPPRVGLWLRSFCFFMEIVTSQKTATSSLSRCSSPSIENRTEIVDRLSRNGAEEAFLSNYYLMTGTVTISRFISLVEIFISSFVDSPIRPLARESVIRLIT